MDQPGMIDRRPLPARTEVSAPYWDGLAEGRVRFQRCGACGNAQLPPDLTCLQCGSPALTWEDATGRGTLYSWTIAYPPLLPYFAERAPWPVAAVELEEGLRVIATIEDLDPADYEIGLPLEASFEPVAEDVTLLTFKPRSPVA